MTVVFDRRHHWSCGYTPLLITHEDIGSPPFFPQIFCIFGSGRDGFPSLGAFPGPLVPTLVGGRRPSVSCLPSGVQGPSSLDFSGSADEDSGFCRIFPSLLLLLCQAIDCPFRHGLGRPIAFHGFSLLHPPCGCQRGAVLVSCPSLVARRVAR